MMMIKPPFFYVRCFYITRQPNQIEDKMLGINEVTFL